MKHAKMIGMAAVIAAGLTGATAASAMPFGYGPPDREVIIEQAAGGCGPGLHPNPWGHCRPNGWGSGWGGPRGYGYGGGPDRGYGGGYGRGGYGGGYGDGGPRRFGGW